MKFQIFAVAALAAMLPVCDADAAPTAQCIAVDGPEFTAPTLPSDLYEPDVIKADLESWIAQSLATHPKFDMAVDLGDLMKVKAEIRDAIDRPMNELEVFRLFSRLNSVFNDGHHGIALSGRNAKISDAVAQGDRLFPLEVHIDDAYRVFVKKPFQELEVGAQIISINGVNAADMARHLEERSHGDTPRFRRQLVADRFSELVWQHFGSARQFQLGVQQESGCQYQTVEGSAEIMAHRRNDPGFEPRFNLTFLSGGDVAHLKVGSFYLPGGTDQWEAFIQHAFAQIQRRGVRHLIIDVRENGGGDDTLWIEGIMPRVAGKSWQRMANFLGRVRDSDEAFPGRTGEVAVFDYQGRYEVSDRRVFDGTLYVVTGDLTYSSAIMFTTAVQDNGLGLIVGRQTEARSCSTGMSNYHDLQVGGMVAFTPIHWYQRSDGTQSCLAGVVPDIELADNPFDPEDLIGQLVARIRAGR